MSERQRSGDEETGGIQTKPPERLDPAGRDRDWKATDGFCPRVLTRKPSADR